MTARINLFAIALSAFILGAPRGSAQSSTAADLHSGTCGTCRITLSEVVRFGAAEDDGMITSKWMLPFQLHGGRWASSDAGEPGVLRVYDAKGAYVDRYAAYGEGPGEFQSVAALLTTADGYLLYDMRLGRLSSFTSSFEYLGSDQLARTALRLTIMPDGHLLMNAVSPGGVTRGELIHVATSEGEIIRSVGGGGRAVALEAGSTALHRVFDSDTNGHIWTSSIDEYEVSGFNRSGERVAVFTGTEPFAVTKTPRNRTEALQYPPPSKVESLFVDPGGRIWVLLHVADPQWRRAILALESMRAVPDDRAYLDSILEVIDPTTGEVLVSRRMPGALKEVNRSESAETWPMYYELRKLEDGRLEVVVLEARLVSR